MPRQYIRIGQYHVCSNFIPITFTNPIIRQSMTFIILLVIKKKGNKHTKVLQVYAHTIKAPEVSPS
jgi:hypothetical protein